MFPRLIDFNFLARVQKNGGDSPCGIIIYLYIWDIFKYIVPSVIN